MTTTGVLALLVAVVGTVRQRNEARAVRRGRLAPLGPDGRLPARGGVHARVAGWRPSRPSGRLGRALAATWSAPLTGAGLVVALLGGRRPRRAEALGCLLATGVVGPTGAALGAMGADAATVGRVVVARSERPSTRLLWHEAEHVRQQERLGPLFVVLYPLAQAWWGYRDNPFEVAARAAAAQRADAARRGISRAPR